MNIVDQYLELSSRYNGKMPIYKTRRTGEEWDRTDEKVRICTKCEIAWEPPLSGEHGKYDYYLDYPTIGKKREDCPKCK